MGKTTWFLTGDDFPEKFISSFVERGIAPPLLVSGFDLNRFSRLVLGSISLNLTAKARVFDELPTLSAFQLSALDETFANESACFRSLVEEFPHIIRLSAAAIVGAFALAQLRGAGIANAAEEAAMVGQMGEKKRKSSRRLQGFLKRMPHYAVVEYVYGATGQQVSKGRSDIPDWLRKGI